MIIFIYHLEGGRIVILYRLGHFESNESFKEEIGLGTVEIHLEYMRILEITQSNGEGSGNSYSEYIVVVSVHLCIFPELC
jgi:hypothetical protein